MKLNRWCALAAVLCLVTACNPKPPEGASANASATDAAPATAVNPADLVPCEVIGRRRVTAEDCELAQKTEQDVAGGVAAFNWPRQMRREKPVLLRLAVGQAPAVAADQATPAPPPADTAAPGEAAPPPEPAKPPAPHRDRPGAAPPRPEDAVHDLEGETVPYAPLVGRYMSARLTGDGFDIVAMSPEHQEVLRDSVTTWDWLVTPKAGGVRTLTITTQVEFKDSAGTYVPLRFLPQTRKVEVSVPWWLWVKDTLTAMPGWIQLLTAVVTALTALVAAWAAFRLAFRGKPQPPGPAA